MAAVKSHEAEQFLRKLPPNASAFLFYGNDDGLVSERAVAACKGLAAATSPPGEILRVDDADLERDPSIVSTELTTISMFGGRRIIRITASRRFTAATAKPLLQTALEGALVVEAGNLKPDEGLRGLFEKSPNAYAVACYPDEARDLEGLIRTTLSAFKLDISVEARQLLVSRLGADRAQTRMEIEKLALYGADKPRIEVADVEVATGDSSELALDHVVMATASGKAADALAAADRAYTAGESPQALIISAQRYFQRLHRVRAAFEQTGSMEQAIKSLRPPLHFKSRDLFARQAQGWTAARLMLAMERITRAQRDARSGVLDDTLAADRMVLDLSRLAEATMARATSAGRPRGMATR